jgi:hypothetical protein
MLVVSGLGWAIAGLLGWGAPVSGWRGWVWLAALVAACSLTPLANPYGVALPQVWFALIGSPILPRIMAEHAPLLQAGASAWAVIGVAVLYLAALVGTFPGRPRVSWLLPLAWLGLSWTRIRYGPLFSVTAGLAVIEMFPHIRWVHWLARKGSTTCRIRLPVEQAQRAPARWGSILVPAALILSAVVLEVAGVTFPVLGAGWARPSSHEFPTALLPELDRCQAGRTEGTRIFNDMQFGGFLIYYTPELRIFIDDRCELYGDAWLKEYADAFRDHPEQVEQWAMQYGFNLALVRPNQGFDTYLQSAPGWIAFKGCEAGALYARVSGPLATWPAEWKGPAPAP